MTDQPSVGTPNMNVPPPPAQAGRSWIRWLLIGGGGYLVLVVLLLVGFAGCLAALGGGGGEEPTPEDEYAAAKRNAVPVGETVEVGDVAWTVSNVENATELKALGERKQGNFIIVDATFINNGDEPTTLDSESLAILDDQGRTHETDPDASFYVPTNRDLFLNQVNPGVTKQGGPFSPSPPTRRG